MTYAVYVSHNCVEYNAMYSTPLTIISAPSSKLLYGSELSETVHVMNEVVFLFYEKLRPIVL